MKVTYGKEFPGYDYYNFTRDRVHELIDVCNAFLKSDKCVKIEFDDIEETMHAVSLLFDVFQKYNQYNVKLQVKGNAIYMRKEIPFGYSEKEILQAIFGK